MLLGLFKSKRRNLEEDITLEKLSEGITSTFEVTKGSDLEMQLHMLDLTKNDFIIARSIQPLIKEDVHALVKQFYDNLYTNSDLIDIINTHSSLDQLQNSLRRHVVEMFSGVMNESFIAQRKRIANVHVDIGLTQKWYIASFNNLFNGIVESIVKQMTNQDDRYQVIKTVYKLLNLEQQVVLEAYDEEMSRRKEADMRIKIELIQSLEQTANELASLAEETTASIQQMTTQVGIITESSKHGTEVAASAKNSADEGQTQLTTMSDSLGKMEDSTSEVTSDMAELEERSTQIEDIIHIVKSIADQTNLLALNASIEAARAGEHGVGFAVVADEVRKLAEQTGQSVTNVTELIHETGEQINTSAASIQQMRTYMNEVREQMKVTEAAFHTIHDGMDLTQQSNENIQTDLEGINQAIKEVDQASSVISESADQLNHMIDETKVTS